ncbi:MAG: hypothetical protein MRZ79_20500 [Bacteroidia bacterium]|nr:hypothetical protein [Bacteroidia bacterium]
MLEKYKKSFRKILSYFPEHWREEFNIGYYISMLVFLGVSVYLNYFLLERYTIERWMQIQGYGKEICILYYMIFYGIPFYVGVGLYAFFHKKWEIFSNSEFWIRSLFILLVLSFDACFYYYKFIYEGWESPSMRRLGFKVFGNMSSIVAVFIPLLIFFLIYDRKKLSSFYGLTFKGFDYRPYVILMLLMVPLVIAASFETGFKNYYPTLKYHRIKGLTEIPIWLAYVVYEIVYALDFIWTEVIFRGFMVIGMRYALGAASVGTMSAVYCYRHFAKPMGESISSIFGGYILGVISRKSNNVMGGVFVHMGIALLMELSAFFQWFLSS